MTNTHDDLVEQSRHITNETEQATYSKNTIYRCPLCGDVFRYKIFNISIYNPSGMINTIAILPCDHSFILTIDANGMIRSHTNIEKNISISFEHIDTTSLKKQEIRLIRLHKEYIDAKQTEEAFKIHEQLHSLRSRIEDMEGSR